MYVSVHLHKCNVTTSVTYTSEAIGTSSVIDHILCPEHLLPLFKLYSSSGWLHQSLWSWPHLCLHIQLFRGDPSMHDRGFIPNTCRSKLSTLALSDGYTAEVDSHIQWLSLPDLSTLMGSPNLIDNILQQVTNILVSSTRKHVPAKQFLPHLRPS